MDLAAARPIVFIGPSIHIVEARTILDADFRPPCRRGDLVDVAAGSVVCLIDGVFDQVNAISPREILLATQRGVRVYGAASMGALRAAEVAEMHGIGRIFELYATGAIEADDEVAVRFDPERLVPLTTPLVNVRYAVERLASSGTIAEDVAARIVAAAKSLHYTQRTYRAILAEAGLIDRADAGDLIALLEATDLKRHDARLLLEHVARLDATTPVAVADAVRDHRPQRPDYGAADSLGGVDPLRATDPAADVFIWETGDRMPFGELIDFMVVTNRLEPHASSVLTALLLADALPLDTIDVEPPMACRSALRRSSESWGWRTADETRVTLVDLGLSRRDLLGSLRGDAIVNGARGMLLRQRHPRFMNGLRAELFRQDIALKREAMIYGSLRALAGERWIDDRPARAAAERLVCRLHRVANWTAVEQRAADFGVGEETLQRFVGLLASATQPDRVPAPASTDAWRSIDAAFGLTPSPKPSGDARYSAPMDLACAHAQHIREHIGVTRVGLIHSLTDLEGVFVSQVARPAGAWSSSYGSGKSETRDGAIVGGVMEEFEKWANEQFRPDLTRASYRELSQSGASVVDPARLDLPYDTAYTPDLTLSWQCVADLIGGRDLYAPAAAFVGHRGGTNNVYASARAGRVVFSTNGLASGFSRADALVHAVCEYVERHHAKLAELRVENPGLSRATAWPRSIDLVSTGDATRQTIDRLVGAGYDVRLYDIACDIAIPTVSARVTRDGVAAAGWAAHPTADVACQRALLEACQTIACGVAGGREDLTVQARSLGRHERPKPLRARAEMFWSRPDPGVPLQALGGAEHADVYDDFCWIRARLHAAGIEHLLAADLSVASLAPAAAIRVVIPDLETNSPFHCGARARRVLLDELLLT